MKSLATFLSCCALLAAFLCSLRFKQVHWSVTLVIVTQLIAGVAHATVIQRMATDADSYARWFFGAQAPALLASLICAFTFATSAGKTSAVYSVYAWSGASTAIVLLLIKAMTLMHWTEGGRLIVCGIWFTCGGVALLSLANTTDHFGSVARLALGAFWMVVSIHGFSTIMARLNPQPQIAWFAGKTWMTGFIATVMFGWLAFQLSGGQREGARLLDTANEREAQRELQVAVSQRSARP